MIRNIYITLILLTLFACDKENTFDCIKRTGDIISQDVFLEDYDKIEIYDNINLILSNDSNSTIQIRTGENLIPKVHFVVNNGILTIENKNYCNFLRNYTPVDIQVGILGTNYITLHGYGKVTNLDTLITNTLNIESKHSSGEINLTIDTYRSNIYSNGLSSFTLTGQTEHLHVGHYYNDGIFHGEMLAAEHVTVLHRGWNQINIYPIHSLDAQIENIGDLVIHHMPTDTTISIIHIGELLFSL